MLEYFVWINALMTAFALIVNRLTLHKFTGKFNPDDETIWAAVFNANDNDAKSLIKIIVTDKFWKMWLWVFISEIVWMLVV